jgi:hypothetical protein
MSLTLLTPNQPTIEHNYLELLIFCNTLRPYTDTVNTSTALSILMYKDITEEFTEITNSILIVCLLKEQAIYQKLK